MTHKERVLKTIKGEPVDEVPAFTGFGAVIVDGLQKYDLRFAHVHLDADEMAKAAKATTELAGVDAIVVPFDMGVEAEALGATLNTYAHSEDILYPTLRDKFVHSADDIKLPDDFATAGRVPVVTEAIKKIKAEYGDEYAVASWVLGPFTLAGQVMDLNELLKMSFKEPEKAEGILDKLSDMIIGVGKAYIDAGADYITLREMGATSDVLSPRAYKKQIKQFSQRIVDEFKAAGVPVVYHICGDTNMIITDMAELGADAVSVDQKNDLVASREKLGDDVVLFGNINPWDVFSQGSKEEVEKAVKDALAQGVDAVWPGCDLWPDTPIENLKAWVELSHSAESRRNGK
ncbi:MAG: methylcobamide:CoM methyltransferase MtaA [Thermoleophilia bacterium]